ncbi:hypothetical protein [Acidiphilium sp.]|uniref:hypothetical protein n=1 Tax=Acidiphilium sp. TaxID=527 RepID=UPI00258D34AC|nr:hypothetical protein [Acidiphilium sp.]
MANTPHLATNPALIALVAACAGAVTPMIQPARANIVIIAANTKSATDGTLAGSAVVRPSRAANAPALPPRHPGYPIVQGFGVAIPLATALPLIVPPYVTVQFGTGIDRDMPCSWRGGLPWPATLATALAPLGLHVNPTKTTANITIKQKT